MIVIPIIKGTERQMTPKAINKGRTSIHVLLLFRLPSPIMYCSETASIAALFRTTPLDPPVVPPV
jgi:hypothetical protein